MSPRLDPELDEEPPSWYRRIHDLKDSAAQRVLGRYYDPHFVNLELLMIFLSLFGIHGAVNGIEGSLGILGVLGVLQLWIASKLYRSEQRWRSRSGPDRGGAL
jgi:hypothetical protein